MEKEHLEEVKEEASTQGGRGDMVQMELRYSGATHPFIAGSHDAEYVALQQYSRLGSYVIFPNLTHKTETGTAKKVGG
jgi:hypothetical protein